MLSPLPRRASTSCFPRLASHVLPPPIASTSCLATTSEDRTIHHESRKFGLFFGATHLSSSALSPLKNHPHKYSRCHDHPAASVGCSLMQDSHLTCCDAEVVDHRTTCPEGVAVAATVAEQLGDERHLHGDVQGFGALCRRVATTSPTGAPTAAGNVTYSMRRRHWPLIIAPR